MPPDIVPPGGESKSGRFFLSHSTSCSTSTIVPLHPPSLRALITHRWLCCSSLTGKSSEYSVTPSISTIAHAFMNTSQWVICPRPETCPRPPQHGSSTATITLPSHFHPRQLKPASRDIRLKLGGGVAQVAIGRANAFGHHALFLPPAQCGAANLKKLANLGCRQEAVSQDGGLRCSVRMLRGHAWPP